MKWLNPGMSLVADWPAPRRVRTLITTRHGGVSAPPYASLNLGDHVGDSPKAVSENRRRLAQSLPAPPCWLAQVHGTRIVEARSDAHWQAPSADGAFSTNADVVCAVMTADCLPVLLCDRSGHVVAAVHAGWRGLQAGVLERAVLAMGAHSQDILAFLGPAIGPTAFVVGDDVRKSFIAARSVAARAFRPLCNRPEVNDETMPKQARKWLADIYLLARQALGDVGVSAVFGGGYCTVRQAGDFFSFRRDGVTGRMASLIWLAQE